MFKKLTTFKMVYETKSFSKAADLLFIVQPTVSAQIKQLELEFGTALFIRQGRKEVIATPQADLLYQKIGTLLTDWEDVQQAIQLQKDSMTHCVIAASHTFAIYVLPDLFPALQQAFPHIAFQLKMMNSLEVLNALNHHDIDLGFIEKPLSAKHVKRSPILTDQLVLAGDPNAEFWLVREKTSGVYYYTKRYLEEHDDQKPQLIIENNDMIIALLQKGFGRSIVSERAAQGLPYQVLSEKYNRQFYLIRQEADASSELSRLIQWIENWTDLKRLNR